MHQEFDPRDLEPTLPTRPERAGRSKVAPIMIALVALAGFGGVVWYAYDQGVRQTQPPGVTPLIKADTSPTKVRPEQPGGMDVPHQDKLVLNALGDGDKAGAPAVERLLPPPEAPLPRPTATSPATRSAPAPTVSTPILPPKIGPAPAAAATPPTAPTPASTQTQTASVPAATPAPAAPPPKPADKSAPDKTQTAAAPAAAPKPAPAAPSVSAGSGGFKVQLVSVKQQDQTGQEWARLQHSYPELAPLHMSVMRVDLGEKGIWYRIYGGPLSDAAAAGQLCGALKAKNQGCVVVKP